VSDTAGKMVLTP